VSRKDRRIVLLCQCLVNPYCRVHILGQNFPLTLELMNYLLGKKIGVVQFPCPETTAMGLNRNPQGRQQYDNIFFRNHCKELLKTPMLMVREFIHNRYRLCCFIGLENSPTCGIHWGRHRVNRYGTESLSPEEAPGTDSPVLMGIMAEIVAQELGREDLVVPFLEFPALSQPASEKRTRFWEDLEAAITLPPGESHHAG
jgi:predicted secreted protein